MLPSSAGREASSGGSAPPYVRHRPERTLLYQLVEEYYPAFQAHLVAQGTDLPGYVQQEFEDYLKCGRLEHGFLPVRCDSCHAEHLVAFSCKRRVLLRASCPPPSALRASLRLFKIAPGDFVCPSCGARRMVESAALLVEEVFPEQPVRQWVLSVPYPVRFCSPAAPRSWAECSVLSTAASPRIWSRRRVLRRTAQVGGVTLIQRFGSALTKSPGAIRSGSTSTNRQASRFAQPKAAAERSDTGRYLVRPVRPAAVRCGSSPASRTPMSSRRSSLTWMGKRPSPKPAGGRRAGRRRSGGCLTREDRPQDDLVWAVSSAARPWRRLAGKTGGEGESAPARPSPGRAFGSETRICTLMDEPAWPAGGRYPGRPGRPGETKRCEPPKRRFILPIRANIN